MATLLRPEAAGSRKLRVLACGILLPGSLDGLLPAWAPVPADNPAAQGREGQQPGLLVLNQNLCHVSFLSLELVNGGLHESGFKVQKVFMNLDLRFRRSS